MRALGGLEGILRAGKPTRESVFGTLAEYFRDAAWGVRSVLTSCFTAVPYFFSAGDLRKEVTEQYPDRISSRTAVDLPARSRGLLFNAIDRCTGCRECEQVCPVRCIRIDTEPGSDASKIWVSVFDIDFAKCIFCGLCVDVCLPQSLVHTKQYEDSVYDLRRMVSHFGRGGVTPEQREKWAAMRRAAEEGEEGFL